MLRVERAPYAFGGRSWLLGLSSHEQQDRTGEESRRWPLRGRAGGKSSARLVSRAFRIGELQLGVDMTTSTFSKAMLARLRAYLAFKGMTQHDLAKRLGHPVSTLSTWLRGVAPAPKDLIKRIEQALKLPVGGLTSDHHLENKE